VSDRARKNVTSSSRPRDTGGRTRIAVSRHTLVIHAVAAACFSLGGFGCGGKVNSVVASDAATGGNVFDQSASAGGDGSGLSSSGGGGSGSGGGPGSTSSSSGSGGSCATTCTNGCCDSTGSCRNSGDDTCGFFGAACSDCTATGATCVSGRCVAETSVRCDAGMGAPVSPDAGACFIDFTQYDRSCSSDSDCVSTVTLPCAVYTNGARLSEVYVHFGTFCDGCNCNGGAAISQRAVAQYIADVSRTPEGSGQIAFPICNCPPPPPATPMCKNGSCVVP
jgi:hypothetical protein